MAFKTPRAKNKIIKKKIYVKKMMNIFFSSRGLPIFLACTIFGILFVLFRMKSVEQDYQLSHLSKEIKKIKLINKGLKAERAKGLSMKNLKKLAFKYQLKGPGQKQIIVIP